eukprot:293492-Amphidinium_carterae.2
MAAMVYGTAWEASPTDAYSSRGNVIVQYPRRSKLRQGDVRRMKASSNRRKQGSSREPGRATRCTPGC